MDAMMRVVLVVASFLGLIRSGGGDEPIPPDTRPVLDAPGGVRFRAVDVYVDPGDRPLAAYQFELKADGADVKIVGVEGGQHAAFKEPPYYDPKALMGGRVIIAAFNTGRDLPKGKTRVATIHLQVTGDAAPRYTTELMTAASADGERIPATVSVDQRKGENR